MEALSLAAGKRELRPQAAARLVRQVAGARDKGGRAYARPEAIANYLSQHADTTVLEGITDAVVVFTTDWDRIVTRCFGPREGAFLDYSIHQVRGFRFLLANVTPGAASACHYLEVLISLGVRRFLVLGHSGALTGHLRLGDLVVHTQALCGDAISVRYQRSSRIARPHPRLAAVLERTCGLVEFDAPPLRFDCGPTVTVDSMFHQTSAAMTKMRCSGALTLEAEVAAIFALAKRRGVEAASLSVVSNLCYTRSWVQGWWSPEVLRAKYAMVFIALGALGFAVPASTGSRGATQEEE